MTQKHYDVACVPCADYTQDACRAALCQALEALDALAWLRPGMTVGIKANLVAAHAPDDAVTTHPRLLAALCQLLRERGAQVILGDSPGGLYNEAALRRIYRATGLLDLEGPGVRLNWNFAQKTAHFKDAQEAKTFQYTAWLDDCDAIINFCKLKSHGMMALSAGVKNLFGVIPGTRKPEYHFQYPDPARFAQMLVDLNLYFKPRLTLCDAVVAMEGNGPTQGTPRPIGCLLAAADPNALDLVCAHLMGLTPSQVPTLQAACQRGLIPSSLQDLAFFGNPDAFQQKDFQVAPIPASLLFRDTLRGRWGNAFGTVAARCLTAKPKLHTGRCTGCGQCARICPARAITLRSGKPVINRSACIRCFCCQEFCPQGAMRIARPLPARILNP